MFYHKPVPFESLSEELQLEYKKHEASVKAEKKIDVSAGKKKLTQSRLNFQPLDGGNHAPAWLSAGNSAKKNLVQTKLLVRSNTSGSGSKKKL